ncbi:MAG TPA: PAS domain-containing protein [Puia sp.]|nr:PAS domain-containing protein [Puia sp.]
MNSNRVNITEWVASLANRKSYYLAIVDENGQLIFTNSRFYTHFVSRESVVQDNFFELVHQGDREHLKDTLSICSKQLSAVDTELRLENDRCHLIRWKVSSVRKRGRDDKFLFLGYDAVEQQKKADECEVLDYEVIPEEVAVGSRFSDDGGTNNARDEERKADERLLHISKATSDAVWDWNMKTGQIYFNQTMHGMIAADLDQIVDLNWLYRCIHPEDRDNVKKTIGRISETKAESWEAEFRFLMPDGKYKMMHNHGIFTYENNHQVAMTGSLQDVSEIRKLESQMDGQRLKQQNAVAEAIIKAQEDERTRIGYELHDNINQILASGQLYLNLLNVNNEDFTEIKDKTMEILQLAIEEIRCLSRSMVVPTFKDCKLVANIHDLVEDLRFVNIFDIHFSHSKACQLELMSQSTKITLFRIIQEQTRNIVKYSKAKHVVIALHVHEDRIRLEIKDDGQGFDPKATRRGLGLSNIYERTRLSNGMVMLNTAPGKGCSIIINIPYGSHPMLP